MRDDFDRVMAIGGYYKGDKHLRDRHCRQTNNFEPMRAGYGWGPDRKLNSSLIYSFLLSNLGRKWDDIYSEVNRKVDRRTRRGKLVFKWLDNQVYTKTWRDEDGDLWVHTFCGAQRVKGVLWRDTLHVDPEGYLRYIPRRPIRRFPKVDPDFKKIDEIHEYRRIEGIWYWLEFEWKRESLDIPRYKIVEHKEGYADWLRFPRWKPGRVKVLLQKKQLNKKELRALGIKNR